mgnify:CR=1 FL=1
MSKLVVSDIASDYASKQKINSNFDAVVAAIENTLSRDGESPNEMGADLDMNSNRILNLPAPVADQEPLRKVDGQSILDDAQADADAAAASAAASAASASAASGSASSAWCECGWRARPAPARRAHRCRTCRRPRPRAARR